MVSREQRAGGCGRGAGAAHAGCGVNPTHLWTRMKEASVGGGVGVGVSVAGGAGVSVEVGRGVAVMNAWQVGHTAFGRVAEAVGACPAEHDAIRIENRSAVETSWRERTAGGDSGTPI